MTQRKKFHKNLDTHGDYNGNDLDNDYGKRVNDVKVNCDKTDIRMEF